jgi:hypothetical protein
MELETALRAFRMLEEMRYQWTGETIDRPSLNVRLDALTTRTMGERDFRLFVRVDDAPEASESEDNLRAILDVARELDMVAELENSGVALWQDS